MSRKHRLAHRLAFPYSLDAFDNVHHQEVKQAIGPKDQVIVYHGTSTVYLKQILQSGWLRPDTEHMNWETRTPGLYVATQSGFFGTEMYANKAVQAVGGHEIVLELVVPYGYLQIDPDDTTYEDAEGKMQRHREMATPPPIEQAKGGVKQAMITKPVPLRALKSVMLFNEGLADLRGNPMGKEMFERNKLGWMPIGVFLDFLKKAGRKMELPPDLAALAADKPARMNRQVVREEDAQYIARGLEGMYQNYIAFDTSKFATILAWVRQNQINRFSPVKTVFENLVQFLLGGRMTPETLQNMPDLNPRMPMYQYLRSEGYYPEHE